MTSDTCSPTSIFLFSLPTSSLFTLLPSPRVLSLSPLELVRSCAWPRTCSPSGVQRRRVPWGKAVVDRSEQDCKGEIPRERRRDPLGCVMATAVGPLGGQAGLWRRDPLGEAMGSPGGPVCRGGRGCGGSGPLGGWGSSAGPAQAVLRRQDLLEQVL
jgi:hypothetical protein